MHRHMLKSKIHRATVTACDPDYIGSVTIDADLMRQADLLPNEQVHVWDIENGARMVTYALEGPPGSGQLQLNGAAARLVSIGDKVIVASYGSYAEADLDSYSPIVVHVDTANRVVGTDSNPEVLLAGIEGRWTEEVPGTLGSGGEERRGRLQ
jgi:aspartate 1-decarboxylase